MRKLINSHSYTSGLFSNDRLRNRPSHNLIAASLLGGIQGLIGSIEQRVYGNVIFAAPA